MSPLRERSFRRLWIAGLISDTGDWLLLVSLPILVYRYTGSTLGAAAAFLVQLAPPVLLAPVAGRVADRGDRRLTLTAISLAQAAALTPLLMVHGRTGLPLLYLVLVAQSALAAVFDPAKNALLPTLVPDDRLVSANSLVALNQNVGRLVGGSLGGVLLAVGGGLTLIVAADGVSFLIAAALIAGLAPAVAGRTAARRRGRTSPGRRRVDRRAQGPADPWRPAGAAHGQRGPGHLRRAVHRVRRADPARGLGGDRPAASRAGDRRHRGRAGPGGGAPPRAGGSHRVGGGGLRAA